MREYELTIIIQPEISEEGSAAILAKLDAILEKDGAIRLLCEDQGKRKLAYEIQKFHKGHYHMLFFLHDGKCVAELERTLRIEESVLRFLTVKVKDEVIDVEARVAEARELEVELQKRAAEKAAREVEEAKARVEAERERAEAAEAARVASEAAEAAKAAEAGEGEGAEGAEAGEASTEDGAAAEAPAAAEAAAAPDAAEKSEVAEESKEVPA